MTPNSAALPQAVTFRCSALGHRFGERVVLREVELTLSEHRIGVVGLNGSGKSTLARMLNGLIVPETGQVFVDGLDTATQGAQVRRLVGFVFTDADAQIVMPTVAEDVRFSLRLRARRRLALTNQTVGDGPDLRGRPGLARLRERLEVLHRTRLSPETLAQIEERVASALAEVGLERHADHPAHLLSGGQKQLLALTSVLVTEPRAIVLDEPTTLLDARNARAMVDRLRALPQQIVLVTHQTSLLKDFDRVVVLDEGRVVADGPPDEALALYEEIVRG